jgi:hypothetical protein
MRTLIKCTLLAAYLATGLNILNVAAGEVYYRWSDERGNPVHSDRPPPKGTDYEVITTGSGFRREVDAEEGAVPLEVKPTPSNNFVPIKEENTIKKNPEFCARARDNLTQLDTKARIRARNEQGEVRYLNDEEKENERKKAQEAISAYCE